MNLSLNEEGKAALGLVPDNAFAAQLVIHIFVSLQ